MYISLEPYICWNTTKNLNFTFFKFVRSMACFQGLCCGIFLFYGIMNYLLAFTLSFLNYLKNFPQIEF